jgi:hypothetical protein
MNSASVKWLVALGVIAAAVASGRTARAEGEGEKKDEGKGEAHGGFSLSLGGGGGHAVAEGEGPPGGETGEPKHKEHEHGEHSAHVGLDFVLGFGKTAVAVATPSSTGLLPSYGMSSARIHTESLVLGTAFKVMPHTSIGILLPLAWGQYSATETGGDSRGTAALGAIEVEGEYERHLAKNMALEAAFGISLPTAQGSEIPENVTDLPSNAVNTPDYDKGGVVRSAALSRGGENNALWEPKRLGFNPKVGVAYHEGELHVTGYLKMENLIATVSSVDHKYLGELVPGVRAGYRMGMVEPALKIWANLAFAGTNEGEKKFGLSVEPQVVAHLEHNIKPVLGVVIPVVGPGVDPFQFVGVRAGVAAMF